ncbi:DeoR/GlpR family DNA-binding transcription regulator [Vibrio sp. VB16]|uniref:DeoR/GlpR family DNA-binding transcription regulator n=1 Tax=Vibrio sp. VB16 TaxID=2785746 RepID=UPI0018A10A4D|nr:DeoR/GlpR family DNA-binding transcription regulator [Vibrio sp. VB16]UGA57053.1 DeoR/GlpR family DNA-binding transcription regulator [Vibrio sp. VB16]
MNVLERHERILELLKENGRVEVKNLVELFDTSEVTVRADLRKLEKNNKLKRFHGGAQSLQSLPNSIENEREIKLERRYKINASAKERIAITAAKYVEAGNSVILDSGSTTHIVAEHIAEKGEIIAITNNLPAASALAEAPNTTLVICGGTYRVKTKSLHGTKAEQCLDGVSADILFIGADGIDPEKGITTFNDGYTISAVMASCAKKIIAVVDSTKMGRVGFNSVLGNDKIDILITDCDCSDEYVEGFRAQGIEVVIA